MRVFLDEDYEDIVSYMNNAFFIKDQNLFVFLRSSLNQGAKTDDELRKLIYEFLAQYIEQNAQHTTEYICEIFKIIYGYFNHEVSARPKQSALQPLISII